MTVSFQGDRLFAHSWRLLGAYIFRRMGHSTNEQVIASLYEAFASRDGDAMAACYHPEARFSDPVFVDLDARQVAGMWKMFCERGEDLEITFSDVSATEEAGSAHWEARYKFTATGRSVHNVIDASFEFRDGKIVRHRDDFDFYRWSRMALGPLGVALGWSPIVRNKVRSQARAQLDRYLGEGS